MTDSIDDRPLLVIPSDCGVEPMTLTEIVAGRFRLLWLTDPAVALPQSLHRILRKFGQVLDVTGEPPQNVAKMVGKFRPNGVVTFWDRRILELSYLAAELGLPFHQPEVALRLVDKYLQREALAAAGLPVPGYGILSEGLDDLFAAETLSSVTYPAVLKPRRGCGSEYVYGVQSFDQLVQVMTALRAEGMVEPMILEEFLLPLPRPDADAIAPMVSVESYLSDGELSHVAITGRFALVEPFRETGNFVPADLGASQREDVLELAAAAAGAMGAESGCFHTEIKLTPDGPRVIEVNGRVAGGGTPQLIQRVGGVDLFDIAIRLATGQRVPPIQPVSPRGIAYFALVQPPVTARRVVRIDGLDALASRPGVDRVMVNRHPGEEVDWKLGYPEFVLRADGMAADFNELRDAYRYLHGEVVIGYD
jgi:biotin carboxylase